VNYGRNKPTSESLDIAQRVASDLGMTFHRKSTAKLALELHKNYYTEIMKLLNIGTSEELSFLDGSIQKVDAFAQLNGKGKSIVFFDEHFDFWLTNLVFLNSITTFKILSLEQYRNIAFLFEETLSITYMTQEHKEVREKIKPILFKHIDALPFAHEFSKAMIAFVICHEIAHWKLGHLNLKKSIEHEYEADSLALDYLTLIIQQKEQGIYFKLDNRSLAAPILLFNYFSIYERYLFKKFGQSHDCSTHPDPILRSEKIWKTLKNHKNRAFHECLEAFLKGLKDIFEELQLPDLPKPK